MSFTNEVYETLSSNLEMKRFLHIVKDDDRNSYDYMIPIGNLTSYYNLTLLQKVKPTNHTPDCTHLPKNNLLIYHKLKYIEFLIYKKRIKHRKKMIDFANSVLEFLIKWKKSDDGMIIHVNEEELKTYLVADPNSVVILLNKFNFYVSLITPILNSFSTRESVQSELIYVIEDISKSLIKRTSFFPIHRLQDKFETLFLSPLLPFKEKMDEFVKDFPPSESQIYLQEIFSFVLSIFSVLKISQKPYDSSLVLLIIRLLFDKVYERNVYLISEGQDILQELSHITAKELSPPPDFSPPISSDDTQIGDLFRNDKYYSKAVSELQNIVFYTNPFDLLNCVDSSLSVIEKSATEYNNYQTMVFPFEVTFELFMAVVIASQIPNWENISKLVRNYTPNVGLCPSFEFSKAKIAASVMQFKNMIDEMLGEDVNERKEKASDYLENASKNCEMKKGDKNIGFLDNFIENKPNLDENGNNDNLNIDKDEINTNNANQDKIHNMNNSLDQKEIENNENEKENNSEIKVTLNEKSTENPIIQQKDTTSESFIKNEILNENTNNAESMINESKIENTENEITKEQTLENTDNISKEPTITNPENTTKELVIENTSNEPTAENTENETTKEPAAENTENETTKEPAAENIENETTKEPTAENTENESSVENTENETTKEPTVENTLNEPTVENTDNTTATNESEKESIKENPNQDTNF